MHTDKDYEGNMIIPFTILTSVFYVRESVAKIVNVCRVAVLFWGCNPKLINSVQDYLMNQSKRAANPELRLQGIYTCGLFTMQSPAQRMNGELHSNKIKAFLITQLSEPNHRPKIISGVTMKLMLRFAHKFLHHRDEHEKFVSHR